MRINAGIYIEERNVYTTMQFRPNLYLGCPINAVMHFQKFNYDEILIINKTRFIDSLEILQLKKYAEVASKPKCYAGGVRKFEQAKSIIEVGYERLSIRSLYFKNRNEYRKILNFVGRQSVTLCLDIIRVDGVYKIAIDQEIIQNLAEFTLDKADYPGEILLNSIDRNGMLSGVDFELVKMFADKQLPININYCGGVVSNKEIKEISKLSVTAVTLFSYASTINNGMDKLLNNNIFYGSTV